MKIKLQHCVLILAGLFLMNPMAKADSRGDDELGLYGDVVGDPFPGLWGVNLAYNITDFLRLNAGYGSFPSTSLTVGTATGTLSASSIGGGAKFFVPGWNLSPTVGINYTNLSVGMSGVSVSGLSVGGLSASGSVFYATFGLDWQTSYGLDIGAGYNFMFSPTTGGLPYLNLGWFFKI